MTLPISICLLPAKKNLTCTQKFLFGVDIVGSSTTIVLGILCIIQLGIGKHIWSGLNSFNSLRGFASQGGMLAVGAIWLTSSAAVAPIYLKNRTASIRKAETATLKKNGKISTFLIDDKQLPNALDDDYQTTKKKVTYIVEHVERIYQEVTGRSYQRPERIQEFLNTSNATWETTAASWSYRSTLQIACNTYLKGACTDLLESANADVKHMMQEMVTDHSKLFKGNTVIINDWVHFPHLKGEKPKPPNPDTAWPAAVRCIENGSSSHGCTRVVKDLEPSSDNFHSTDFTDFDYSSNSNCSLAEFVRTELSGEYKIHLMFKQEWIPSGVEKFLEALESNQTLRDSIKTFKVSPNGENRTNPDGKVVPVMVIYPCYGKTHAQTALDELMKIFQPYFSWGNGRCPRYNVNLGNPLVYYAQGDSMQKMDLEQQKPQIFRQLYDLPGEHYNPQYGSFKLTIH